MKQLKAIMVVLVCLVPALVYAQGNDFPDPPPYFVPPQPGPFPPLSDQGPYKWRAVGRSQTISALKGWKFTVALHVNWFPGPMWLQPAMSDGSEVKYVSGFFYHGDAGNWCIDECTFEGIAGSDYPELTLQAYAPYRFIETNGAYLYVTEIVPNPAQPRLIEQAVKDKNTQFTAVANTFAGLMASAGVAIWYGGSPGVGAILIGLGYGGYRFGQWFGRIDPYDPNYGERYWPQVDPQVEQDLAWVCEGIEDSICPQLIEAIKQGDAYLAAAAISGDRFQTCIDLKAGCEGERRAEAIEYLHDAANWLAWAGSLHGYLADYMQANGINADPTDAIGNLYAYRDMLWDASSTYSQVQ